MSDDRTVLKVFLEKLNGRRIHFQESVCTEDEPSGLKHEENIKN